VGFWEILIYSAGRGPRCGFRWRRLDEEVEVLRKAVRDASGRSDMGEEVKFANKQSIETNNSLKQNLGEIRRSSPSFEAVP